MLWPVYKPRERARVLMVDPPWPLSEARTGGTRLSGKIICT